MNFFPSTLTWNGLRAMLLLGSVLALGCHAFHLPTERLLPVDEVEQPAPRAEAESNDDKPLQNYPTPLGQGAWVQRITPSGAAPAEPPPRWRHADLEELIATPAEARPVFPAWLDHENPVVAGNAAIALARLGEGDPVARLSATVQHPLTSLAVEQRMNMRRAAAEALGEVKSPAALAELQRLTAQFGAPQDPKARPVPPLHAELLAALAKQTKPAAEPLFVAALKSEAPEVRRAAAEAWPLAGEGELPAEFVALVGDSDAATREAALRRLAGWKHTQALEMAERGLHDQKLEVRMAAIAALGEIGGDAAQQKLKTLRQDRIDRVRAAAVAALADCEAWPQVWAAVEDPSWRVRVVVAQSLGERASPEAQGLAKRLLNDPSSEVTAAVIAAVKTWPREQAAPIFQQALTSVAFTTRQTAAAALREVWEQCPPFDPAAADARRAEQLGEIQKHWGEQFAAAAPDLDAAPRAVAFQPEPPRAARPEVVSSIEPLLRRLAAPTATPVEQQATIEELKGYGVDLPPALAVLAMERKQPIPEVVYAEVLPAVEPLFGHIQRLRLPAPEERRRMAEELKRQLEQAPLSDFALARLTDVVAHENDGLVWVSVQNALAADARPAVVNLQTIGLGHPTPEVRRRACGYFAAHPTPALEGRLLEMLDDDQTNVVLAAIDALSRLPELQNALPLMRLLVSREKTVRLAAATALAQRGYDGGYDAIERFAHETDPGLRRAAAEAMGKTKQRRFVDPLIGLLDDQLGVKRAALEALTQIVGRDIGKGDDAEAPNQAEQIIRWKSWHARNGARG